MATFAELGVPLTTVLHVNDTPYTLKSILDDMLAYMDIHQNEFEWQAIVLATYMPPQTKWHNRFGESTSLDDVARTMASADLSQASCAGTHMYNAMVRLMIADIKTPVLSEKKGSELRARVAELTMNAIRNQCQDGGFPIRWWSTGTTSSTPASSDLTATGHLLECLLLAPEELSISTSAKTRAASWLWLKLQDTKEEVAKKQRCPLTHAACAIKQLLVTQNAFLDSPHRSTK